MNWLRKYGRVAPEVWPMDASDPSTVAVARVDLERAVATLGPEGRELLRLLYVDDRPVAEVARALDVPVGTVKSRAYKLRRTLQAALGIGEGR